MSVGNVDLTKVSEELSVSVGETVQVEVWTKLSLRHLYIARILADQCRSIEQDSLTEGDKREILDRDIGYAIACLFAVVAYLEATINELFADARDGTIDYAKQVGEDARMDMASQWDCENFRYHTCILKKFQIALELAGAPRFDKGKKPYQDVSLVVRLRNELVHYKPEWTTVYPKQVGGSKNKSGCQIERSLSGKFPENPLATPGDLFFPVRCLGYGCARWAVNSCIDFVRKFYSRMRISPSKDEIRLLELLA